MSLGFVDTANLSWKIENFYDLVKDRTNRSKFDVISKEFSLDNHPRVKLELEFDGDFRILVKDVGDVDVWIGYATLTLNGLKSSANLKTDGMISVDATNSEDPKQFSYFNYINHTSFFDMNFSTMLIKLYIDIRKYQEKIVKITELPFANRSTFVQTKVFTESDLEFAFRFYPNYNSRNSGHSSLSLFQFEGIRLINTSGDKETHLFDYQKPQVRTFPLELKFRVAPFYNQLPEPVEFPKYPNYSELHKHQEYTDCKVVVQDEEIKAHKLILAINSKFFSDAFGTTYKFSCVITNLSPKLVNSFINFFYSGNPKDLIGSDEELFKTASVLGVEPLKKYYEQKLCKLVDNSNAINFFELANEFDGSELKRTCLKLIVTFPNNIPVKMIGDIYDAISNVRF